MNSLNKEESDRLLAVLESHVRRSTLSQREVERRLGLSQGYLGALFQGRIQLKVAHVYGIARVLDLEPIYFFLLATPPQNPEWLMGQLGIGESLIPSFLKASEKLPTRQEILEIMRTTIRAELERLLGPLKKSEPVQG